MAKIYTFGNGGGNAKITVNTNTTTQYTLTLSGDADLLSFDGTTSKILKGTGYTEINLTCNANTGGTKTAKLNIYPYSGNTSSGEYENITFEIKAAESTLTLNPIEISNADATGETRNIQVTANYDWTASTANTWITITPTTGSSTNTGFTLTIEENKGTTARNGKVTVKSGTKTQILSVTQKGADAYAVVSGNTSAVPSGKSIVNISVKSNTSWVIESTEPWATLDKTSGTGNDDTIKLTIAANTGTTERSVDINSIPN